MSMPLKSSVRGTIKGNGVRGKSGTELRAWFGVNRVTPNLPRSVVGTVR